MIQIPSVEDIPQYVADYLGINLVSAQAFLSVIVVLAVLLPVLILTRGRGIVIPAIVLLLVEALLVGITWLNSWVLVATLAVASLFLAKMGASAVTGG